MYKKFQKAGNARHLEKPYWRLYTRLLASAKARGLHVSLSYEQYLRFTKQPYCHYCGAKLQWRKHGTTATRVNLDRKNNKSGYNIRNVVASCFKCNTARSRNFSYKDWYAMTKVLRSRK